MLACTRAFRIARALCVGGIHAALLLHPSSVQAAPGAAHAEWDRPPPRAVDPSIPLAARGFQVALRTGAQLPWGEASDAQGDDLAQRYGWQLPVLVDVGVKLSKPWLLGLYGGVGFGTLGTGNEAEQACADPGVDCSTMSYQFGFQAQYQFAASDRFNPWLGMGAGYEIFRQSLSYAGYTETQQTSGISLAKLALGLDYRHGLFGFGPFAEVSLGRFQASRTVVNGEDAHEGPVEPATWHGFFTLGVRLVVMP